MDISIITLYVSIMGAAGTIAIPLLIHWDILKPRSTVEERMKKKILKKLKKLVNKKRILLPEIQLRDMIYRDYLGGKPLLKERFFSLFIESIRELSDSEKIICENRWELFYPYPSPFPPYKKEIDPFPPYESRINVTPSDYSLREDNPDIYVGLKTKECEERVKSLKERVAYIAGKAAETVR